MRAEFEEKQFEQALNFELANANRFLYTPGQCLENILGFDAGIFTSNLDFWNLFPNYRFFRHYFRQFYFYPEGIELRREMWDELEREIDNEYFFPQVKFNLFIQHKRPEYLYRRNASEWYLWNGAYYRYNLTRHQQEALENLDNQMQNNGIVVYSSPAFHTLRELWNSKNNNLLVINTNFIQVSRLSYHSKFTYNQAGNYGIGFSEPEEIESFNFKNKIAELFQKEDRRKNSEIFKDLEIAIDRIMQENKIYSEIYRNMVEKQVNEYKLNELQRTFKKINAFLFLTNTTMMSGINTKE